MALLDLINNCQDKLSLPRTTSIIGATDQNTRTLLACANDEGKEVSTDFEWTVLENEYTFTLTSGTANYALPTDFDRHIPQTQWDRNFHWELIGPVTPQEWQFRKSGIIASSPRRRFRIKTRVSNQFYLDPTPASSDTGLTMVLEYYSASWVQPKQWVTSTAFAAGSYCSNNGIYYKTTAGGTTGATVPTHTSGSVSDGGVTWTYNTDVFDHFVADTDTTLIPQVCIELGVMWRFLMSKGMASWQSYKAKYDEMIPRWSSKTRGARTIDMSNSVWGERFIGPWNAPDTGYGS